MLRIEWGEQEQLPYQVGALLYSPANNKKIAKDIIAQRFTQPYSVAFCLEDAISDFAVKEAEHILVQTFETLHDAQKKQQFYMPKLFIRVRNVEQMEPLLRRMKSAQKLLTGFIFPKFSLENGPKYCERIEEINQLREKRLYMMPILESADLVNLTTRFERLAQIKSLLDAYRPYVLNVRVGGNDFCNQFGVRRHVDETIYDIRCIGNLLADIVTCFARDYVVSGPVWEYFGEHNGMWEKGMTREVKQDRLNGFIGKTVIHPTQIAVVNRQLAVTEEDYRDAESIFQLAKNPELFVEKNVTGNRMNEYKTHTAWAKKILILKDIYGVRGQCEKTVIPLRS
ncbi:MAG: HpcH/HpaI aldolase/citrate lyase family protein [Lachnospiraceae bacterium]